MDFTLPEELALLRDSVRGFAKEHIEPHAQEWDRQSSFPDSMIKLLGEQGYMGIMIPEEYGGAAGTYMMFAIVLEEIARYDGGLALAVEAHNGLCCQHIMLAGNEDQKKKYLPSLAAGDQIGSWCLSEPDSGSDAAGMKTRAVRDGDAYVLNGSKQFITNGDRAGTYVVTAVTDPEGGKNRISAFVVERDTPGLSVGKREEKLGMRSSDTVVVQLQDVRVPAENLLGEEGKGFDTVKKVLQRGRVMVSALSIGFARGALEEAAGYARERKAFGKPIADFQMIQAKLADMAANYEAGRMLLWKAATSLDNGAYSQYVAATAKLFISEMATKVCMDAIQVLGGYGYLRDYNVERYMRDAKLVEIGEGTSEIMRILIAKSLEV